jgi:hypothetical protein
MPSEHEAEINFVLSTGYLNNASHEWTLPDSEHNNYRFALSTCNFASSGTSPSSVVYSAFVAKKYQTIQHQQNTVFRTFDTLWCLRSGICNQVRDAEGTCQAPSLIGEERLVGHRAPGMLTELTRREQEQGRSLACWYVSAGRAGGCPEMAGLVSCGDLYPPGDQNRTPAVISEEKGRVKAWTWQLRRVEMWV